MFSSSPLPVITELTNWKGLLLCLSNLHFDSTSNHPILLPTAWLFNIFNIKGIMKKEKKKPTLFKKKKGQITHTHTQKKREFTRVCLPLLRMCHFCPTESIGQEAAKKKCDQNSSLTSLRGILSTAVYCPFCLIFHLTTVKCRSLFNSGHLA